MINKMCFYILIFVFSNCSQKISKDQISNQKISEENLQVKGRILDRYLGEFRSYSGHPIGISVTLELTNNSDTPYLICGLDGDIIFKNENFVDTIRIYHSMFIEPNSTDTIRNTLVLPANTKKAERSNYEKGSFTYFSKNECIVDGATLPDGIFNDDKIPLNIKPIDYVLFEEE